MAPVYTIRTSDRRLFRRCWRKWGYLSPLRGNYRHVGAEQNINFWFGSGIHFALEDYHGHNIFKDPRRAFRAYYKSFKPEELPEGAVEYYSLGIGMLTYYLSWYPRHNKDMQIETAWLDKDMNPVAPFTEGAHPAVEQQFYVDIGQQAIVVEKTGEIIKRYESSDEFYLVRQSIHNFDGIEEAIFYPGEDGSLIRVQIVPIQYHGTMDRIIVDRYGRYWILDYKTAKGADTNKLDTDDQISAYLWAATQVFPFPIYGFVYLQLTKSVPAVPKRLKNNELSVDKKQKITHAIFKQALLDEYGSMQKVPGKYVEFLNLLAEKETPEGDRFIRWDFVQRSSYQIQATYNNITAETKMMLDQDLYLFPNPTRDCIWDCPVRDICLAQDDNRLEEVKLTLTTVFAKAERKEAGHVEPWRLNLVLPTGDEPEPTDAEFENELMDITMAMEEEGLDLTKIEDANPYAGYELYTFDGQ